MRRPHHIFQSTLPQGERLAVCPGGEEAVLFQSTLMTKLALQYQFQSTLPQGERPPPRSRLAASRPFQSTLPQGERLRIINHIYALKHISIHAPTRGATKKGSGKTTLMTFQSTLPQGERRIVVFYFIVSHYFNPRSHKGSDSFKKVVNPCTCISIHAPTRGATIRQILFRITWSISIHAPTRGATSLTMR